MTFRRTYGLLLFFASLVAADGTSQETETGFVRVGEDRLYFEEAGSGRALVLLHDGLVHSAGMRAQLEGLSREHRVVTYDRRGYGRSDTPSERYSPVDDLRALLDSLRVERAVLLGASAGAAGAVEFALASPDRVAGLVLVGPVVSGYGFSEHFRRRGSENMAPLREGGHREAMRNWVEDRYLLASGSTGARERLWELIAPLARKHLTNPTDMAEAPERPALPRLSGIQTPTLIVVGEEDAPDVHSHAGAIQVGIAGSERVVVEDAGHLVFFERPRAFNRMVLEFLDDVDW